MIDSTIVFVVFSLLSKASLKLDSNTAENLANWIGILKECSKKIPTVVLGNKEDGEIPE